MKRTSFALVIAFATVAQAHAQDAGPYPTTLHPAPLPSPALKYRLLPDLRNQTAGNAVPLWEEAIAKLKPLKRDFDERPKWRELFLKWSETPIKELPREEVRKALEPYKEVLDLIDRAARREHCDWDMPQRMRKRGLNALLPEVQELREMALLLSVCARLEIADGDLTRAARTLQTGLALAKQTGEQPTLINYLVGTAIAQIMLRQVDDFVQQPKAPNLYWALTDLPQPLIDPGKGFEAERIVVAATFPGIAEAMVDLNAGPISEEQVQGCVQVLVPPDQAGRFDLIQKKQRLAKYVADHYDENKKVLLAQGRPQEKVESMPHVQVALLADINAFDQMMDEQMKWYNEPYYKVAKQLDQAARLLQTPPRGKTVLPEESYIFLATTVNKVFKARARLERKLNLLRCVEAVRAYAAAHDGKLPASLNDIKDVPIPLDPVTGKPFEYQATGDKALLQAPAVFKEVTPSFPEVAYEITIKRS